MQRRGSDTVNQGPATKDRSGDREFDMTGNVKEKGEDPSPDDRERGEGSGADRGAPLDRETSSS